MDYSEKSCFIVTPIGGDNTDVRRSAEGAIDAVIIPLLTEIGFELDNIKVAHRMSQSGSINKQLITRILEDDLVIVNLTELNPNVMYELAVRHAVRKPVVQICEHGTNLPFDITDERTIFYTNDMTGVLELKKNLLPLVKTALNEEEELDNPIYRAITSSTILKDVQITDSEKYLVERLDLLEERIGNKLNESRFISESKYSERYKKNESSFKYIFGFRADEHPDPFLLENKLIQTGVISSVRIIPYGEKLFRLKVGLFEKIPTEELRKLIRDTVGDELELIGSK
ncbi:hypothetical protein [Bacillus atrophaeus]|uniref:hypothetical protein n=1 Tax=Bacillus atrophaeus TaxID=1452 RepID=UPI002281F9AF|nr:hypothetical protein [Bacillus atrophaeus]MCY8824498.1 hypothetical protein [Bacillus atrophaeus]